MNRPEKTMDQRITGQTQGAGFQIGVRRTFPIPVQDAWNFLTSEQGLRIWLGESSPFELKKGATYSLHDGTRGSIRVMNPGVNIRLSWQPQAWSKASIVQVRTIPSDTGTVISFHQEGLVGAKERADMRRHWQQVLAELETSLSPAQLS